MRKFEEKIDITYSKRIMKELSGFVETVHQHQMPSTERQITLFQK